jgi:beta-lactam-binding protein with PASTA domain
MNARRSPRGWAVGLAVLATVASLALASAPALAADAPVPDVVGQPRAQAVSALASAGFLVATVEVAGTPPDTVASQEPASGSSAAIGSVVTILVRRSVAVATTSPQAVGLTVGEATSALGSVYLLKLEEVAGAATQRGKVVEQSPEPGAALDFRGTLTLRFVADPAVPQKIPAPDLQGLSAAEAQSEAARAGLHARVATADLAGAPPDVVVAQRPAPGTELARYSTVDVVVSTGAGGEPPAPAPVSVPNLTDLSEASARAELESAGLLAQVEWVAGDPTRAFLVDSQDPPPGTQVDAGSSVRVAIVRWSPPPPPEPAHAVVPNLIHRTQGQAEAMLAAAGLLANPVLLEKPGAIPFRVFGQQTAPGSHVPVGTTVTFRVAKPPPPPTPVPVPNFWMRTKAQSIALAVNAGLLIDVDAVLNPAHPVGRAFSQSIPAGTVVALGTKVVVKIAKHPPGPPMATVPNLLGKTAAQANAALAAAGLGADPHQAVAPGKPLFKVFKQDPAAGTDVPVGSVVHYTTAKSILGGLKFVPDVVGKTKAQAALAIAALGFTADFDTVVTNAHPAGKVYHQSPAAGQLRAPGTTIHMKVAQAAAATVTVPNLIGLTKPQANAVLALKGLGSNGQTVFMFGKPLHKVYSQSKLPGTHVAPGTVISWKANP